MGSRSYVVNKSPLLHVVRGEEVDVDIHQTNVTDAHVDELPANSLGDIAALDDRTPLTLQKWDSVKCDKEWLMEHGINVPGGTLRKPTVSEMYSYFNYTGEAVTVCTTDGHVCKLPPEDENLGEFVVVSTIDNKDGVVNLNALHEEEINNKVLQYDRTSRRYKVTTAQLYSHSEIIIDSLNVKMSLNALMTPQLHRSNLVHAKSNTSTHTGLMFGCVMVVNDSFDGKSDYWVNLDGTATRVPVCSSPKLESGLFRFVKKPGGEIQWIPVDGDKNDSVDRWYHIPIFDTVDEAERSSMDTVLQIELTKLKETHQKELESLKSDYEKTITKLNQEVIDLKDKIRKNQLNLDNERYLLETDRNRIKAKENTETRTDNFISTMVKAISVIGGLGLMLLK